MSTSGVATLLAAIAAVWTGLAFSSVGREVILLSLCLLLLMAVLHRPAWGLWVLVLVHPVTHAYPGSISRAANVGLPALILGAWALHLLWQRREVHLPPRSLTVWFGLFTAWIFFTSMFSPVPAAGLMTCFRYLLIAAVLTAFLNLWNRVHFGRALFLLALALIPIAVIGIRQAMTLGPAVEFDVLTPIRFYSIYNNPNTLGIFMGHGVVIMTAYVAVFASRRRTSARRLALTLLLLGITLVLGAGLALSISRSSILYAGTAIGVLILSRREVRPAATAGILASIVLVMIWAPTLALYAIRPSSGLSYRDSLWRAGWRMLKENPWTGVGPGGDIFENLRHEYVTTEEYRGLLTTLGGQAHNVFLTQGAAMGWAGVLLTVALFALLLRRVPSAIRAYQDGDWVMGVAGAGMVGLTVRSFFEAGNTLGPGQVSDSLVFFLFALLLLRGRDGSTITEPAEDTVRSGPPGSLSMGARFL